MSVVNALVKGTQNTNLLIYVKSRVWGKQFWRLPPSAIGASRYSNYSVKRWLISPLMRVDPTPAIANHHSLAPDPLSLFHEVIIATENRTSASWRFAHSAECINPQPLSIKIETKIASTVCVLQSASKHFLLVSSRWEPSFWMRPCLRASTVLTESIQHSVYIDLCRHTSTPLWSALWTGTKINCTPSIKHFTAVGNAGQFTSFLFPSPRLQTFETSK